MSLSEKLIIAAKNGSTREVRKLLGRGALFTKDQVHLTEHLHDFMKAYNITLYCTLAEWYLHQFALQQLLHSSESV